MPSTSASDVVESLRCLVWMLSSSSKGVVGLNSAPPSSHETQVVRIASNLHSSQEELTIANMAGFGRVSSILLT